MQRLKRRVEGITTPLPSPPVALPPLSQLRTVRLLHFHALQDGFSGVGLHASLFDAVSRYQHGFVMSYAPSPVTARLPES